MPQTKFKNKSTKIVVIPPSSLSDRGCSANIHPEGYVYFTRNDKGSKNIQSSGKEDENEKAKEQCDNVSTVISYQGDGGNDKITEVDKCRTQDLNTEEGQIKVDELRRAQEITSQTVSDSSQSVLNKQRKTLYKKLNKNIILVRNINKAQERTLLNVKNVKQVNSGEHTYCQVKEVSEEVNVDADNVVDSDQTKRNHSGHVIKNCQNNISLRECAVPEKMDQSDIDNLTSDTGCIKDEEEKNECSDELEIDYQDTKEEFNSNLNSNVKNNNVVSWASSQNSLFGKRKLHKSYMTTWSTQIAQFGAAKCLIETCNFISLDLPTIQEHYRSCDGVSQNDINVCPMCRCWLNSQSELIIHKLFCKSGGKNVDSSSNENNTEVKGIQSSEVRIGGFTEGLVNSSTAEAAKYCEQCDQEFSSNEDYSRHLRSCKKGLNEVTTVIKKRKDPSMCVSKVLSKRINEDFDESCIVQPGRVIPKGQYVRRRAYTKQHKAAWEAAIKKYKYVKCIFQNCHFLAMSVEDMISHFGYCNGDGSFAKFTCPYCEGRVTSERILEIHIRRSHTFEHCDTVNSHFLEMNAMNDDGSGSPQVDRKEFSSGEMIGYASDGELRLSEGVEESFEVKTETAGCDYEDRAVSRDLYYYEDENSSPDDGDEALASELPNNESATGKQTLDCEGGQEYEEENDNFYASQDGNVDGSSGRRSSEHSDDTSQNCVQKVQHSPKNMYERDYKDDHIYFKRKGKVIGRDQDSTASLLVMKNSNLRHYSGPRNVNERSQKDDEMVNEEVIISENESVVNEKGNYLSSSRISESASDFGSDHGGKYVRQMIKFSFPSIQNTRRKVHQCYTNSWTESIKTNGFARCLVATCNFISLDIFHIQNHFKTCNGVPANGPNLCNFCNSWLPSAVELSIHESKCKANVSASEVASICDDSARENDPAGEGRKILDSSGTETRDCSDGQETDIDAESERLTESDVGTCSSSSGGKNDPATDACSKKDKAPSLRISDIMKLKDSGNMDYNRIIQPGPVLPKGQYLRRRAYTKQHKAVWEAALEKHKYVKCIFQNCHFLAMSLEDMIYHFGYCIGDGSFAKFECPHCKGRLTTELVLDIHIRASHPEMVTDENPPLPLPTNGENDANDVLLTSLDELKKLVAVKEIKTYARQSRQSKAAQPKVSDVIVVKSEPAGSGEGEFSSCATEVSTNTGGFTSSEDVVVEEDINQRHSNVSTLHSSKSDVVKEESDLRSSSVVCISLVESDAMLEKDGNMDSHIESDQLASSTANTNPTVGNSKSSERVSGDRGMSSSLVKTSVEDEKNKFGGAPVQSNQPEKCELVSHSERRDGDSDKSKPSSSAHSDGGTDCNQSGTEVDSFSQETGRTEEPDVDALPLELENSEKEMADSSSKKSNGELLSSNKSGTTKNGAANDGDGGETSKKTSANGNSKPNPKEESKTAEVTESEQKPVRRRGRKPKSQTLQEAATNLGSVSKDGKSTKESKDVDSGPERRSKRRIADIEGSSKVVAELDKSEVETTKEEESNSKRLKVEETSESVDREKAAINPTPRRRGRPPKKVPSVEVTPKPMPAAPEPPTKGRRGRKRKSEMAGTGDEVGESAGAEEVKCALCEFRTKRRLFSDHNFKKHVGLSWIEGDRPIDMDNEELISWNIKQAFKFVKSATCRSCNSVKKSALGFISHIQNCGKSEEEKEALKVTCPHCPARILKYSLPMHLKLSHSDSPGDGSRGRSSSDEESTSEQQPSKRKSAIRAVNKFHEVLKQCDDEDDSKIVRYVLYEKGVSKFPTLPHKIRGLWNKMKKENRKIPCRRGSCLAESSTIQEARRHHFMCSELPDKSFVCLLCDYYSIDEGNVQEHVNIHPKNSGADGDFTIGSDEEKLEDEVEMDYELEGEEAAQGSQHRPKASDSSADDSALEAAYRAKFFAREKLLNERKIRFCRRSLYMTLDSELEEAKEQNLSWLNMDTKASEWIAVDPDNAASHLPSLEESMSFQLVSYTKKVSEPTWRRFRRFEADIVEGSPLIFTGGGILSMSWCKVSCVRAFNESPRQYLAVSSSRKMDKYQDIHKVCEDSSGLIQIWDCGEMKSSRKASCEVPKMAMGIIHDSGEVWDLSWLPLDTYKKSEDEASLTRIGVLCAACSDGTVRVWSICDPQQLKCESSLPLYRAEPSVILQLEEKQNEGCLRLACGRTGIIVGGYTTGMIAVWSLKSVSSPFCKRVGKSALLKPHLSFQAHRTSITALSICPNSDRYITTSGLDRYIKFWDLECTVNPFESVQKEVCLDNVWPRHWPLTISTFEDIIPCSGKGMIKAIRDAYCDKHRAPLAMDSTCWSLSFNEWMNILCGCSNVGEVKIRYLRNMFLTDEKFRLRTGNVFSTTELRLNRDVAKDNENSNNETVGEGSGGSKGNGKKGNKKPKESSAVPRTYEEAQQYFGLIFNEYKIDEGATPPKTSPKSEQSVEEYPITSVNKVCWNPNYNSFSYIAIGHQSGFVRIKPLNDFKCDDELSRFFRKAKDVIPEVRMEEED